MRPGSKPTPTQLKILQGNPGRRRLNKNEPQPPAGMPEPPDTLCAIARQEWLEIAPGLAAMGVLTTVDKAVLAAYCQAYADWYRAREGLNEWLDLVAADENGHISDVYCSPTRDGGFKRNALISVHNDAAVLMVRFAAELGLTPSARSRLSLQIADDSEAKLKGLMYGQKQKAKKRG